MDSVASKGGKGGPRVFGIGETVYDVIFRDDVPASATPGGSAFNAIVSLARAGARCSMVTEIGDDHVGDLTARFMVENGVSLRHVTRREGVKSHVSLAFLDRNGDAHYQFYKDHGGIRISGDVPDFQAGDVVLFGSFFAINPAIRPAVLKMLRTARDRGAFLYYDVNFRAAHIPDIPMVMDAIQENMGLATVVRGSLEDFCYLYGSQEAPGNSGGPSGEAGDGRERNVDAEAVYERHIRPNCPNFICTGGPGLVKVMTPALRLSFHARRLEPVSTVGAGDSFNAGFLHRWMDRAAERGAGSQDGAGHARDPLAMAAELTEGDWADLVESGQSFAAQACMSWDNFISREFGRQVRR